MKCLSIILVCMILAVGCLAKPKPFVSINADIPFPIPPVFGSSAVPVDTEIENPSSSKEVETLNKSESVYYGGGYYPYYYGGWPHYGYHGYPLVYVGK